MGYEQNRPPALGHIPHFAQALPLKSDIANRQDFVDHQDFGIQVSCHRKSEAYTHSRRIALERCIKEFLNLRESHDLIKFAFDFALTHAKDSAVEEDVFSAGKLKMEARPDFQQARDATGNTDPSSRGIRNAAQDLQERRFSGSVSSNDAEPLTLVYLKRDVSQGPNLFTVRRKLDFCRSPKGSVYPSPEAGHGVSQSLTQRHVSRFTRASCRER